MTFAMGGVPHTGPWQSRPPVLQAGSLPSKPLGKRYTHTNAEENSSGIKNFAIYNNVDGLGWYYTKWNKSEKDKYCMISLIYEIKKNTISENNKKEADWQIQRMK